MIAGQTGDKTEKKRAYERKPEKMLFTVGMPLICLRHKLGRVKRGPKSNRLFSPYTRIKKDFRKCFSFNGEDIAWLDMQAAQPTLLANRAEDEQMLLDCLSDNFYGHLMELLGVDRKETKRQYCVYAYGKTNEELPIAEAMRAKYPRAAEYMKSRKRMDYRVFSHEMQKAEAAIFVDGVYPRLAKEGIISLTIHDAIACPRKDQSRTRQVIEEELEKHNTRAQIIEERVQRAKQPYST